jgi:hypothetical protein
MEKRCTMNPRFKDLDDTPPSNPSEPAVLNPFVHHLELTSTFDKLKVGTKINYTEGNNKTEILFSLYNSVGVN